MHTFGTLAFYMQYWGICFPSPRICPGSIVRLVSCYFKVNIGICMPKFLIDATHVCMWGILLFNVQNMAKSVIKYEWGLSIWKKNIFIVIACCYKDHNFPKHKV